MTFSSSEASSARQWWSLVAGVAVASSALTTFSILAAQRLSRKHKRHELEDEIRKATQRAQSAVDGPTSAASKEGDQPADFVSVLTSSATARAETATPKYLAALATSQNGYTSSHASSPKPSSRPSSSNFHKLNSQSSFAVRPSISSSSSSGAAFKATLMPPTYDEGLLREQLSRNYSFLGDEAMSKLREAFVIVVGAGGVGSWCALMLLRSGVGKLRLIDFDQVSLSSLNRHACANLADVGKPKVIVCKEKFAEIAPWTQVDARVEIFRGADAGRLLEPLVSEASGSSIRPTYIVDAIDNLDTKVDLLEYCYRHKIKCFSSMGAGAKADPSQVQVADLNTTAEDPLARRVRRSLRVKGIWTSGAMMDKRASKKSRSKVCPRQIVGSTVDGTEETRSDTAYGTTMSKLEGRKPSIKRGDSEAPAVPSNIPQSSNNGYSRYSTQSRRASSASSMGSAKFFSPTATPTEERSISPEQPFRLPEAESEGGSVEKRKSEASIHRPPLSTLQSSSSSEAGPSRRTSSLKELVAEDVRSSQSGNPAKRAVSGISLSIEDVEEEAMDCDGKEEEEEPYKIMCVYSNEKSDTRLLPLDEEEFQKGNVEELAALEDFRVRILPVLGPLPAMFGLAAATYIMCDISGKTLETVPWKNRRKTYERCWTELEATERRYPVSGSGHDMADRALGPRRVTWSTEDVGYVLEEVYRGRSVVPPFETLQSPRMLRWDSTLPLSYSNVAVFTRAQGIKHEQQVLKLGRSPVEVWGDDAYHMYKRRMAEERRMNMLR